MKLARSAAFLLLASPALAPAKELRDGPERERLVERARQYCAAELSEDPYDTGPLFVASMRDMLERSAARSAAEPACEAGLAWSRGASRRFIEVRRGDRTDRLYFRTGEWPLIRNVYYGRKRLVDGRKVGNLWEELATGPAARSAAAAAPPPPRLPDPDCFPPGWHFAFVGTDTTVYRQGGVVRVTPMADRAPGGTVELPLKCTSGWAVTGPATLAADRKSLTIAPDAPPGAVVLVRFRHDGKPVSTQFRVVAEDEIVLTGRYTQRSLDGCIAQEPVRELEFRPENRFSVTFMPFETYQDYWGSYSFDPATRQIRLKVEGGNFVPPHLDLEGEAELADGRLRLKGLFLGSRDGAPQSGCTYVF
ncbi:MAG TPA: hypothetical protein VF650_11660 [Allosphingosinicella sp.]|jgi:hypothetical protein